MVLAVAGIGAFGIRSDAAQIKDGWTEDGKYWYEGGVRQDMTRRTDPIAVKKFTMQTVMRGTGWMQYSTAQKQ